ncbi:hypothetical protein [Deefgea sp. CFH1-16]|uniref:hypothetical protein n=1 Tax=Deefgea sp. CFH1-16 TaxID=2675457 RepID=UPI0019402489|nr:hypothetical protein [Deefgea sp. CFH1-16]
MFSKILEWKKSIKKTATQNIYLTQKSWLKYELPKNKIRDFISDEITINAVQLRNDKVVQHGQLIAFDVDFFIAKDINELEMGIHIF